MGKLWNLLGTPFTLNKETAALRKKVAEDQEALASFKRDYEALSNTKAHYENTLSVMTDSLGAMVWEKDSDHRYVIANQRHCKDYFRFSSMGICLDFIKGKTDAEIIAYTYTPANIVNSMPSACAASDNFVASQTGPCHFLSLGQIDREKIALYVIKTPRLDAYGKFIGSVGIGWDFSSGSNHAEYATLYNFLSAGICGGMVERLSGTVDSECYHVKPAVHKCKVFNHICPEYDSSLLKHLHVIP